MMGFDSPDGTAFFDDDLALQAKMSDSTALALLILKYQEIAKMLVKSYRIAGQEQDDLQQEALTGFIKALRSFEDSCGVSFQAYATLCMKRQLQTAVRAGLAGKQQPLRNYVSLDDDEKLKLQFSNNTCTASPESIVIMDEEARLRKQKIQSLLSAFEQEALNLYLSGHSYEEMSKRMKSTHKSVDNALQRVRRKLRSMKL